MHLPNLKEARIRTKNEVEYVYLDNKNSQEFSNKKYYLKTYGCQMNVHDSEEIAASLESLGFTKINLITNNPKKIVGLEGYDLEINDTVHLPTSINKYNEKYINTKREKMHHTI